MLRGSWLVLAIALAGCIQFERGGAYACTSFDDCADAESCAGGLCLEIAPLARLGGKDARAWAVAWVQWIQELPLTTHPLYDGTGEQCALGQPDDAFFLAGNEIYYGGSTSRSCTVPAGRPLVFPLFWWVDDNNGRPVAERITEAEMKQSVLSAANSVVEVVLELDGRTFDAGVLRALRLNPISLAYHVHDADPVYPPQPDQTTEVSPAYLDGYFVVLPPLRPGQHALRFGSTYTGADGAQASVDSRYLLEVQ